MAGMGNHYGASTIYRESVIRPLAFATRRADMALGPIRVVQGRPGDDDLFKHDRQPPRLILSPRFQWIVKMRFQSANNNVRQIRGVFAGCAVAFIGVGLMSALVNILYLTGSLFMMEVYDRVLPSRSLPTLLALFAIVVALYVFQGLFDAVRGRLLVRISDRLDQVLSSVAFTLASGSALGVIGASGSGKSSLARLLVGLWRPLKGSVRLDGATLDQWPAEALARHIGYMPQAIELLDGTIAENIASMRR